MKLLKGYIFVVLSAVIFGLMPLMAKFIYAEGVNPQTLVLLRNGLAMPFLFALACLGKKPIKVAPSALPSICFIALMGCCVTPMLLFSSYTHIPSGTATVFHFIYPAVVVLGEFLFLKNKIKIGHIISVILCVIGVALFYNPENKVNFAGSFYALLSGVTYAIYVICLSAFKHKELSGFTFSFYVSAVSFVSMLCICLITRCLALPNSISGWLLALLFALSLNVGAVVLFQRGTFIVGGGRASVLSTLEPVTSVLAGVVIFNEGINYFTVIGTLLVISASILIAVYDMRHNE